MPRIKSVDLCRLVAIFAVIAIHTVPFAPSKPEVNGQFGEPGWWINQLARFAVPFFFVVSGYFWALKQQAGAGMAATWAMARRIALIFAAWTLIYFFPSDIAAMVEVGWTAPLKMTYWNVISWLSKPWNIIAQGSKVHLWFLPALLCALVISALLMRKKWYITLAVVSLLLYLAGTLGKSYAATPIGWNTSIELRNGPFFATLLFASGVALSYCVARPGWLFWGIALFAAGMAAHTGEVYVLSQYYGAQAYQDFTFGTYFMGVGFAMAAISDHPSLQGERLAAVGKYTLGIYAIHYVFVDMFKGVRAYTSSPAWELAYPLIVLALSVATVLLMARSPRLRRIIA